MLATDVESTHQSVQSREGAIDAVSDYNEASPGAELDEVLQALSELEVVFRENAEHERVLFQRIGELRLAREAARIGERSWPMKTNRERCSL